VNAAFCLLNQITNKTSRYQSTIVAGTFWFGEKYFPESPGEKVCALSAACQVRDDTGEYESKIMYLCASASTICCSDGFCCTAQTSNAGSKETQSKLLFVTLGTILAVLFW